MAGNTKHHFVPVAYLRPFAGQDNHVWSLDRATGAIKRRGRRNTFFQHHYYRQGWAPPGADPNILEHYFAREVEPAIHALRDLAAGQALDEERAFSCLLYVATQFVRVPAQIDQAVELQRQLIEQRAMQLPDVRDALLSGKFRIVMKKSARFEALGALIQPALRCLQVMQWEVLEAPVPDEFITTDNPVVALNGRFVPPATPGLALRSTCVIFPLSPSISFRLQHRPGTTEVVALDEEEAALPSVTRRIQCSDAQAAAQNKIVGAYARSFVVARSRDVLIRVKRDLDALFAP